MIVIAEQHVSRCAVIRCAGGARRSVCGIDVFSFQRRMPEAALRLFGRTARKQFEAAAVAKVQQRRAPVAFAPGCAEPEAEHIGVKLKALVKIADAERQMVEPAAGNAFVCHGIRPPEWCDAFESRAAFPQHRIRLLC